VKTPYLLISLIFFSSFLYLITWSFSKLYILKKNTHLKIWNVILLLTFLVTAILGILLAAQVNYKWDIPYLKELLNWHVNFGIAMAIISVFHFINHWKYYWHIFSNDKNKLKRYNETQKSYLNKTIQSPYKKRDKIPVLLLGFSAIIIQLVLIREIFSIISGNELIIGIVLSNWMIITGLGAYLGKYSHKIKHSDRFVKFVLLLLPILSIIIVFSINSLKNSVFLPGSIISLYQIIYSTFIILFPVCFLSGYLFTHLSFQLSQKYKQNFIDKTYAFEAIGSLTGGVVFNFILVYFFHSIQILTTLFIINLVVLKFYSAGQIRFQNLISRLLIALALILTFFVFDIDTFSKHFLYKNQNIVINKDTPYGNLIVTKNEDQINFFENSVLLFSTNNVIENEELVHFAMLQKDTINNVLLISGGIKGLANEINKYNIKQIDYVELNPWIIRTGKIFTESLNNKKLNIILKDAKIFIKKTSKKYDIAILDLPGPVTAQTNRFYTTDFFADLKKIVTPKAVIILKLPSTYNYISNSSVKVQSVIYNSLKSKFKNVRIIPGEYNYLIASDKLLQLNYLTLLNKHDFENEYVNEYYLDDYLLQERSKYLESNMLPDTELNTDYKPAAYFYYIAHWLDYFKSNYKPALFIFLVLVLVFIIFLKPLKLGLFTVGFSGASIQFVLIFAFQVIYGFVFQMIGILIMFFMAGLAIGAYFNKRITSKTNIKVFNKYQLALGLLNFIIIGLLILFKKFMIPSFIVYFIFVLIIFSVSVLTGILFSIATHINTNSIINISSSSYGADLAGSALGSVLTSIVFIPFLGIIQTLLLIALLNFLIISINWLRTGKYFS